MLCSVFRYLGRNRVVFQRFLSSSPRRLFIPHYANASRALDSDSLEYLQKQEHDSGPSSTHFHSSDFTEQGQRGQEGQDNMPMFEVTMPNTVDEVREWFSSQGVLIEDDEIKQKDDIVFGFDVEWRPSWRSGTQNRVSLIQFATSTSVCLIQVHKFTENGVLAPIVHHIVASPYIIKTGVGIYADLKKLENDFKVDTNIAGFHDVGATEKRLRDIEEGPKKGLQYGLANLAKKYLDYHPLKPRRVQMSNWAKPSLTSAQIHYAAYDALLGKHVFDAMDNLKLLEVESMENNNQIREEVTHLLYRSASNTGDNVIDRIYSTPMSRTSARSLWLKYEESSTLLQNLADNVIDVEKEWLTWRLKWEADNPKPDLPHDNERRFPNWRTVMFGLLSRLSLGNPIYTTTSNSTQNRTEIIIVCRGRLLARQTGPSRNRATEVACKKVCMEIMELTSNKNAALKFFAAFANKGEMPIELKNWLESHPRPSYV